MKMQTETISHLYNWKSYYSTILSGFCFTILLLFCLSDQMKLICWGKSTAAVSLSIRFYTLAINFLPLRQPRFGLELDHFFTQWLKLAYYTLMLITSKLLNWLLSITFHNNIDFSSGYWITDIIKWFLVTAELNFLLNSMFSWPFCLGSTESARWGRLCCPHFTPHLFPLVQDARSYEIFTKLKVTEKLYLFV